MPRSLSPSIFEHYTFEARQVVFFAVREAHRVGASSLMAEHLLLGLLLRDRLLIERFLRPEQVNAFRGHVETSIGPNEGETSGDLPLTPGARDVLINAKELAEKRNYVTTEPIHILAALVTGKTQVAVCLVEHGLSRQAVKRLLSPGKSRNDS